jgi:hypothetical protein
MSEKITLVLDSDLLIHLYANYKSGSDCKKCERINKILENEIEAMHTRSGNKHE